MNTIPKLIKDLGEIVLEGGLNSKTASGLYLCGYCKSEFICRHTNIIEGQHSCGCQGDAFSHPNGKRYEKLYKVWLNMKNKCTNPKNVSYDLYGERGISVCKEWADNYLVFRKWVYSQGYTNDNRLSIDRIDNDGNYCPENCRMTTMLVQARNKRRIVVDNTTGFRGVSPSFARSKINTSIPKINNYIVQIQVENVKIYLGRFTTPEEGAKIYDIFVFQNNLEHTTNFSRDKYSEEEILNTKIRDLQEFLENNNQKEGGYK